MAKCIVNKHNNYIIYSTFINKDQLYITASVIEKDPNPVITFKEIYIKIFEILTMEKMQVVSERIFGNTIFYPEVSKTRSEVLNEKRIDEKSPFTFIEGQPCWGAGIAGIQITAILLPNKDELKTIFKNDIPYGRKWKKNGATFLMLQNVFNPDEKISRGMQAEGMFNIAQELLKENAGSYKNVVRTWIYLADILDWYSEFNQVRNAKYNEFGFIPNHSSQEAKEKIYLPASTGISGLNPNNAAAVMDVLAVIPDHDSSISIEQTSGKKQASPFHYGSAFSRAMNIKEPENITILLSGTASIDKEGNTVFIGDTKSQIRKTYEVVEALIKEEGAALNDICTATMFFKNAEDYPKYHLASKEYGLNGIPAVCIIADVCRDNLLFELDATLAIETNNK
jgi:enamine deaminase RidA (YjgF/YER057c/UK114 family)